MAGDLGRKLTFLPLLVLLFTLALVDLGGLERREEKELGAGLIWAFPTHSVLLASLFPRLKFNLFFSANPLLGIYLLAFRPALKPVTLTCKVLDHWFSTLAAC